MHPPLDAARLTEALVAQGPFAQVKVVEETGSTNEDLLAGASSQPHLTALLAEHQTQGRGRLHPDEDVPRSWDAPPRSSLLASVLVRPPADGPLPKTLVALAFGLAALDAVDLVLPGGALKWPNDLVFGGRKLAGLLAGVAPTGEVVVGLGLNVHQTGGELPAAASAASLTTLGVPGADRTWLAIAYLAAAGSVYERWVRGDGGLVDGIGRRMETLGRVATVRLPGGRTVSGVAERLGAEGALWLRPGGGPAVRLDAGEVL
jgi:BirA family biotin operon repressor/biotin-[acetyl-CoA-carboxylase] ligase